MRLQLHTTGIEPVTYSLQILRHTMVAAIVQTRLYVFGRSIDFDFDRCRGQFVSTRPMPIPLNFGIAASLVVSESRSGSLRIVIHHAQCQNPTNGQLLEHVRYDVMTLLCQCSIPQHPLVYCDLEAVVPFTSHTAMQLFCSNLSQRLNTEQRGDRTNEQATPRARTSASTYAA